MQTVFDGIILWSSSINRYAAAEDWPRWMHRNQLLNKPWSYLQWTRSWHLWLQRMYVMSSDSCRIICEQRDTDVGVDQLQRRYEKLRPQQVRALLRGLLCVFLWRQGWQEWHPSFRQPVTGTNIAKMVNEMKLLQYLTLTKVLPFQKCWAR